jgi:hypothetical protein
MASDAWSFARPNRHEPEVFVEPSTIGQCLDFIEAILAAPPLTLCCEREGFWPHSPICWWNTAWLEPAFPISTGLRWQSKTKRRFAVLIEASNSSKS